MNYLVVLSVAMFGVMMSVASASSDVTVLTSANFKSTIEAGPALVEFYAPWCGHCKHLAPIYDKLAAEVKGRGVTIAKVDCTIEKTLQQEQGIRGFPTLKLFKNGGKDVVPYNSGRDVASFTAFLEKEGVLGPAVPKVPPHLRYFDTRGRAELIRLVLEESGYGGGAYEDSRFTWDQWLATEKSNTARYAFAQAPQMSIDGLELVQSGAIVRYLARKNEASLYGGVDPVVQTQVDVIFGGFEDLRQKYSALVYDKSFSEKRAEFFEKVVPVWFGHFERLLGANQFFVNGQLTIADLNGYDVLEMIYELEPKSFAAFPGLTGFLKRIVSRPNIAAYRASGRRPKHAHGSSAFCNNEASPATASVNQLLL